MSSQTHSINSARERPTAMKTVLLVDSDEIYRETLAARIGHEIPGILVRTADNGKAALEAIDMAPVDMMVTELNMPVMDGFELLAALKERNSRLPVMVVTEFLLDEIQDILGNLGYYMFHRKGANPSLLIDRVRDVTMSEAEGHLYGVSLAGFLQLLEAERKNCVLTVSDSMRSGRLFVKDGSVVDARTNDLTGQEAAMQIVCWSDVAIQISSEIHEVEPTIELSLQDLLLQAFVSHDEFINQDDNPEG